jgi:hypothetical protein
MDPSGVDHCKVCGAANGRAAWLPASVSQLNLEVKRMKRCSYKMAIEPLLQAISKRIARSHRGKADLDSVKRGIVVGVDDADLTPKGAGETVPAPKPGLTKASHPRTSPVTAVVPTAIEAKQLLAYGVSIGQEVRERITLSTQVNTSRAGAQ